MAEELEIDLNLPVEAVGVEMVDVTTEEQEPTAVETLLGFIESGNIAFELSKEELGEIQNEVSTGYTTDKESRAEWESELKEIHDILKQESESKTYPWPGASNIKYPLILSAVLQFNARAYPALVGDRNVIKCSVFGKDPDGLKKQRADRLSEALNYQILEVMENWTSDMDELTTIIPVDGLVFKKGWYDNSTKSVETELVRALDLVVNDDVKDLKSAPRISQVFGLFPYEIKERENRGEYLEDYNEYEVDDEEASNDEDVCTVIEQHTRLDLDEDGYKEPYIVTFLEDSGRILSIVPNYTLDDIEADENDDILAVEARKTFVKYEFFKSIDGSFYNKGLGALLKPINDSVSSILNQLVDSGHLANTGGGFIGNSFRLKSGALRFSPGEWKKVDVAGSDMRNNIMPLPVPQPSNVLFSLLGLLIDAGKEISSIQDVMTGGGDASAPVGTTLALIEQGTKVYSAVLKRMYRSMKEEFQLIYKLDSVHGDPQEYAELLDDENASFGEDFDLSDFDVAPAADPAMITDIQKASKAQFLMQQAPPPMLDSNKVWTEGMEIAGIENPQQYISPPPEGPSPEMQKEMMEAEFRNRELSIREAELGIKATTAYFDNMKKVADVGKTTAETDEMGGDPDAIAETVMITDGVTNNVRQERERIGTMEGGSSPVSGVPPIS